MHAHDEIPYLRAQIRMYNKERKRYELQGYRQCAKLAENIVLEFIADLHALLADCGFEREDYDTEDANSRYYANPKSIG